MPAKDMKTYQKEWYEKKKILDLMLLLNQKLLDNGKENGIIPLCQINLVADVEKVIMLV
jgi:hypothetical protein